jgi:TonB family protein
MKKLSHSRSYVVSTFRVLLAFSAIALSGTAVRGQSTAASAPRSPDGQPVPAYPRLLARAGVEGEVSLRVAVDSLGKPIPAELRVLRSSHDLFSRAARAAVLEWRFEPGAGPADVRITFALANERGRCDPALAPADSALAPQWYSYDRATASARVAVCVPPTYRIQVSHDGGDRTP